MSNWVFLSDRLVLWSMRKCSVSSEFVPVVRCVVVMLFVVRSLTSKFRLVSCGRMF